MCFIFKTIIALKLILAAICFISPHFWLQIIYEKYWNSFWIDLFLCAEGIPSIGMSPFSCGWITNERHVSILSTKYTLDCIYSSTMDYSLVLSSFPDKVNYSTFIFNMCRYLQPICLPWLRLLILVLHL